MTNQKDSAAVPVVTTSDPQILVVDIALRKAFKVECVDFYWSNIIDDKVDITYEKSGNYIYCHIKCGSKSEQLLALSAAAATMNCGISIEKGKGTYDVVVVFLTGSANYER